MIKMHLYIQIGWCLQIQIFVPTHHRVRYLTCWWSYRQRGSTKWLDSPYRHHGYLGFVETNPVVLKNISAWLKRQTDRQTSWKNNTANPQPWLKKKTLWWNCSMLLVNNRCNLIKRNILTVFEVASKFLHSDMLIHTEIVQWVHGNIHKHPQNKNKLKAWYTTSWWF